MSPTDFLRGEFYKDQEDEKSEELSKLALEALEGALGKLQEFRHQEGEKLLVVLNDHLDGYVKHFQEVEKQGKAYQEVVTTKLRKRFEEFEAEIKVDEQRFLQEVVFYLEKLDITEEFSRINTHREKLNSLLNTQKTEIGRQIDFVIQELNRETNTIGSKAGVDEISENVIQMKVNLEKMREQALNIE